MEMSLEQYHYSLKIWILSAFNDEEELLNIFHFINQLSRSLPLLYPRFYGNGSKNNQ